MAGNAIAAGGRIARAAITRDLILVPPETESARREICHACPRFRKSDGRCSLCGCGTSGRILDKLKYATEKCPDHPPRWLKYTAQPPIHPS